MTTLMEKKKINFKGGTCYSFNKEIIPFSEIVIGKDEKPLPPSPWKECAETKELFIEKKLSKDELYIKLRSEYKKAESAMIATYYTGGGPHKIGVIDVIYNIAGVQRMA